MMKSYRSEKVLIKNSNVSGTGAFSKENIYKGEIVGIRSGHIVYKEEAMLLDKIVGSSLQIDSKRFLCAKTIDEALDILIYLNHSCSPNIGIERQISFIAMRDIKKGEELYLDYATVVAHQYELKCSCGSDCCRKVITGEDWKKEYIQNKYYGYFSTYIQKLISTRNHEK